MAQSKYVRNGTFYLLTTLLTNVIPIVSLAIFTRLLSPADYGFYALSLLYGSILIGICNFGLQIGYERDFFEGTKREANGGLLYTTVLFVTSTVLLVGLLLFIFKEYYSSFIFGQPTHGLLLFWAYLYLGVSGVKNYFMIYFKNTENAKSFFWYSIDEGMISLAISFILVYFLKMGVLGLVLGQFLGSFGVVVFLVRSISKKLHFEIDRPGFKKSFRMSLPLTGKIFFGVISNNFDKFLLGKLSALNGVGIYNLGQKIGYVCFTYTTSIHALFNPTVYRTMFDKGQEGGKEIGIYLSRFFYITIAGALLISLFSEELILVLTPSSYHSAVDIAAIFAMLYGTYFFGMIPQLIYANKTKLSSLLSFISIVISFVLILAFIPIWGAVGAAWGAFISGTIIGLVSFLIGQKYYKIYWEYNKLLPILALFFGSAITLIIMRHSGLIFPARFAFKIIVVIIYYMIGKKFSIIPEFSFLSLKTQVVSFIKNKLK